MKRRKGFTLRFMVSFLVVMSVFITLTLSALVGYRNEKQSLINMTFQLNQTYSNRIADTVNEVFLSMKESLAVTGGYLSKDLSRPDLDEQLELFRRSQSNFNAALIVDKNGIVLSTSPDLLALKGRKLTTAGAKQALQEKRPLISEPYIGMTDTLIILVSQPLFNSKHEYLGYIGGTMPLHETNLLNTLLGDPIHRSNGTYSYVVSSSGVLLYHPDETLIGKQADQEPIVQRIMDGQSGTMRITDMNGIDMLASYTYIKEEGWGIIAQTPTSVVLAQSRGLAVRIVLYALPVLLIFMLVIYWLIGRISAPLVILANYASVLSPHKHQLDELPKIQSWSAEANSLHRAFGMAVSLFRNQFDHLSMEAQTDPLTGLFNRRTMGFYMDDWIAKKLPFVILLIDLDKFKEINDTYGHDQGDEVMIFLTQKLLSHFDQDHICCRYGGEEFVILLPEVELATAVNYAETIRTLMAQTNSPIGRPVTLSIGLAASTGSAIAGDQLFRMADEALYRAKRLGRNRVVCADQIED